MGDDIIKITSKDLEQEPLRITAEDLDSPVKTPQSSSDLIRVTADDVASLARQVGPQQVKRLPFSPPWLLATLSALAIVLLGVVAALIWLNQPKAPAVGLQGTRSATPRGTTPSPVAQASPSRIPSPTLTLSSDATFQVFTDKQFEYEITVPRQWSIKALEGTSEGIPGAPKWSAWIANVEIESLQSLNPDTSFVLKIYQSVIPSEEELMLYLVDQVIAQPDELSRREQGKAIEYRTTKPLSDHFGRPTVARWFWNGNEVLVFIASILNPDAPEVKHLDQVIDSVRLLNP